MTKKTIRNQEPTFIQAINISKDWCSEWEEDLLSDEVLADRIQELIKTKIGKRGFFAYTLSDSECTLLDKLPTSLIYKFRELGEDIVEITIKNLFMSSAQIINHQNNKKYEYAEISNNISERCINLLKELDSKLVTKKINEMVANIDKLGNGINSKAKYTSEQKNFILNKIQKLVK
tara:strand:- start:2300 stop:2827 length:528 start_codon:yes stop_codon:yes gene_type:complete